MNICNICGYDHMQCPQCGRCGDDAPRMSKEAFEGLIHAMGAGGRRLALTEWANQEAKRHRYDSWLEAWEDLK